MWRVYEADGTPNSDWETAVEAQRVCNAHPGWTYGFVYLS
jgi:hypothetical protein